MRIIRLIGTTILAGAFTGQAHAVAVQVQVQDSSGAALADAVVYATPESGASPVKANSIVQIEQIGRKFSPLVSVLQVGTQVSFPNNDTVRHHIYSFSAPKKFELKLYSGVPSENIVFDKPGSVVLGCNIHDKMIAYIYVVETPFFAKSDLNGKATIANLPKGKYQLKVWHYNLPANSPLAESVLQVGAENLSLTVKLASKASANAAAGAASSATVSEFIY